MHLDSHKSCSNRTLYGMAGPPNYQIHSGVTYYQKLIWTATLLSGGPMIVISIAIIGLFSTPRGKHWMRMLVS